MRPEELLRHRRRDPVAPAGGERVEDDGGVQVALVVRGEDHRGREVAQVLEAFDLDSREDAAERAGSRSGGSRAAVPGQGSNRFHEGKSIGSALPPTRPLEWRRGDGPGLRIGDRPGGGELALVHRHLQRSPRAPSSVRRARASSIPARQSSSRRQSIVPARSAGRLSSRFGPTLSPTVAERLLADVPADRTEPVAQFTPLQLPGALRAWQLLARPHRRQANLLVVLQAGVGASHDPVENPCCPASTTMACTRSADPPATGAPTTAESRTPGWSLIAFSTSSGKTFRPSGVTIISFLRPRM